MSVSVAEILRGAAVQAVPLTGECAGYLVLAAADQALTAPREVDAAELHLLDDGSVRAVGTRACSEVDAERDLRQLLDRLLSSASSVTPALLRAGRRAPGAGMAPLLREIERALIPVNRSAARRALARLEREAARAVESGRLTEPPAAPSVPPQRSEAAPASQPVTVRGDSIALEAAHDVAPLELSPVGVVLPAVAPARGLHELPPPPPSRAQLAMLPSLTPPPVVSSAEPPPRQLEVETRPEPIVLRASARPPAPPRSSFETPSEKRGSTTPVLGTVARERPEDAPTWRPPASDRSFEVRFAADERTEFPDDSELIYGDQPQHDLTERCPPALETIVPPPAALTAPPVPDPYRFTPVRRPSAMFSVVPNQTEELVLLDQDDLATPMLTRVAPVTERPEAPSPAAAPTAEAASELELVDDIEILSESEVAPVVAAPPALASEAAPVRTRQERATPHPRIALPKPRQSDVSDLIGQLDAAPLPADEVRSGLKSLAGLEPTPPPPGHDRGD